MLNTKKKKGIPINPLNKKQKRNTNRNLVSTHLSSSVVISAILTTALLLIAPAVLTTKVFAQPPNNDDFDSATIISSLPFSNSINTVEATTAADDPFCAGNGHTVWYSFTPDEDGEVNAFLEANTVGSDYDTTLSVYTGSRGNLEQIA